MIKIRVIVFLIFTGLISPSALAASLNERFETEVQSLINSKQWYAMIDLANIYRSNQNFLNQGELELAVGLALTNLGLPSVASKTYILGIRKFNGTKYSYTMLGKLEELVIDGQVPLEDPFILFNEDQIIELPRKLRSFSAYYQLKKIKATDNEKYFKNNQVRISKKSFWWWLTEYENAVNYYAKSPLKKALKKFQGLDKKTKMFSHLNSKVRLMIARIYFEMRKYKKAIATAKSLKATGRRLADVHNLIAWSYFHIGDYGKALGVLQNLKSPYFANFQNPENTLIELNIYRRLCWKQQAQIVIDNFEEEHENFLEKIALDYYLADNKDILSYMLFYEPAAKEGQFIESTYRQMDTAEKLLKEKPKYKSLFAASLQYLRNINKAHTERLVLDHKGLATRVASNILRVKEQVRLIDYLIDFDSVRGRKHRVPAAIRKDKTKKELARYKKLQWKFNEEYWSDEREDYKFEVISKCHKKRRGKK